MASVKLLVVEDESIVARDIQNRLRNLGYEVPETVAYGEKALEKVAELSPDLVLMDISLKGEVDGIQAAEQIRARYDVPIIFLTAFADAQTLQRAKVTEPCGYVLKPFSERELSTAIEIALYKHSMEKKLRDSQRWLSTTLKSIDDAIIATDTAGRIVLMNPVAEAITGRAEAESLGRPLAEAFTIADEAAGGPAPDPVEAALRDGPARRQRQATLTTRGGARVGIEYSASPIRDDRGQARGAVLAFRDITERRRTEEALRFTQFSVDKAGSEIFWIAQDGRFHYVNEAACRALGYSRDELLQLKVFDIDPTLTPQSWPQKWDSHKGQGGATFESVHRTKAGRLYPVEVITSYISHNDKELECAYARDVTERKAAETTLKAHNRHLAIVGSITATINRAEDVRAMLDGVLRDTLDLLEVDSGAIYLADSDEATDLTLKSAATRSEGGKALRYRPSVRSVLTVAADQVNVSDAAQFLQDGAGPGTIRTVPVKVKDRVIGLIALAAGEGSGSGDADRRGDAAGRTDVRELLGIGSQLGIAVENHRLFRKVREASQYLASIVDESPDAMLTTDGEGRIVSFNRSATRLLAYTADEVARRPVDTLLPAGSTLDLGETKSYVREFRCKDGSLITLNISAAKLDRDGARGGFVITLKDLSEISGLRVAPVTENAAATTQSAYHLEPGLIYLADKRKRQDFMDIFADQVKHNVQGLCVTRQSPQKVREQYGLEKTPIIWLNGGDAAGESVIKPDNITGLAATVHKFTAEARDGLILLDGMEYLMMRSSYETLLKFVHYLNDRIMQSNSRAIFCIDAGTIDDRQLHIFLSEMVDLDKVRALPRPPE